jgi:3-deoxy-D-manno-octulosonic acid kinase
MTLAIPAGFTEHRVGNQVWWLKAGWEATLLEAVTPAVFAPRSTTPTKGGRGALRYISLGDGVKGIIRHYRRGGWVRYFLQDLYWDRPLRPLAELICTEIARQRGVPTVEVLGAGVKWNRLGLYRGVLITREAEEYCHLWEWLQMGKRGTERKVALITVARAIAQLHRAGIAHADLNLTNILLHPTQEAVTVLLIDFDRARVFPGPLPTSQRNRSLRRLRRSLDKLDPGRRFFSSADLQTFCHAYHERFCAATDMGSPVCEGKGPECGRSTVLPRSHRLTRPKG